MTIGIANICSSVLELDHRQILHRYKGSEWTKREQRNQPKRKLKASKEKCSWSQVLQKTECSWSDDIIRSCLIRSYISPDVQCHTPNFDQSSSFKLHFIVYFKFILFVVLSFYSLFSRIFNGILAVVVFLFNYIY